MKIITIGNHGPAQIRLTLIRPEDRGPEANWAGGTVLRIQTVRPNGQLNQGPEVPVGSASQVLELIAAITELTKPV